MKVNTGLKYTVLSITFLYGIAFILCFVAFRSGIYRSFQITKIPSHFWIAERLILVLYVISLVASAYRVILKISSFQLRGLKGAVWLVVAATFPLFVFQYAIALLNLSMKPESAYMGGVFLFGLTALTFLFSDVTGQEKIIRGAELLSHEEARKKAAKAARGHATFQWGGVEMPLADSVKHMLLVGLPGSGKSKLIQMFLESVLPAIGTGIDHKAVIYGGKRNELSVLSGMGLNCNVLCLNPFDQRSVAWDIAKDIDDRDIARTVAESLIAEEKNSSQPYFRNTAALIICACMQALHRKRPHDWDFRDLVLVTRDGERIKKLISSVPEIEYYVSQHCQDTNQAFAGVLSLAAGQIDWLVSLAALSEHATRKISLREWVEKEESILVLGCDFLRDVAMAQINRMILTFLTLSIQNLSDDLYRRIWVVLDEFATLGQLDKIKALLYTGRSKGASVLLAFQEIAQLIQTYGKEGQRIITGNTANKVILASTDPDTGKWAESLFGGQEKYEESHSQNASIVGNRVSIGKNEAIRQKNIVLASEFGDLELASPETGISGFAKSPTTKSYQFNVPGYVVDELSKPNPEVKDFIERPAEQREIKDFSEEEQRFFFEEVEIKQPQLKQNAVKEDIKNKIQNGMKKLQKIIE